MAHRTILTERQRSALFDLPSDEVSLLQHYILADDDLEIIRSRRRARNQFGFALQLCALRFRASWPEAASLGFFGNNS